MQCRFKHTRQPGPPPDPQIFEAAKPKELRNVNLVANQANEGILALEARHRRGRQDHYPALPGPPGGQDNSLLASVGQANLQYGF